MLLLCKMQLVKDSHLQFKKGEVMQPSFFLCLEFVDSNNVDKYKSLILEIQKLDEILKKEDPKVLRDLRRRLAQEAYSLHCSATIAVMQDVNALIQFKKSFEQYREVTRLEVSDGNLLRFVIHDGNYFIILDDNTDTDIQTTDERLFTLG